MIEVDAATLTREAYRDAAGLAPAGGIDRSLYALYSRERNPKGTIFILDRHLTEGRRSGEDPLDNPIFQERLLHERVHHAQYHGGAYRRFACPALGERDAYPLGGQGAGSNPVLYPSDNA